jgi:hypothetical protein
MVKRIESRFLLWFRVERVTSVVEDSRDVLDPKTGQASRRKGKWTEVEDSKLKDAVQTRGDKDWGAISFLVPGRTRSQCNYRWHRTFNPSIALTARRKGKWVDDEDSKLKEAVQTHGHKD